MSNVTGLPVWLDVRVCKELHLGGTDQDNLRFFIAFSPIELLTLLTCLIQVLIIRNSNTLASVPLVVSM